MMEERRKGREFFLYSNLEGEGSKIPKHQKDRQKEDTLPFKSFVDVHVKQFEVFPSGDIRSERFSGSPFSTRI
jgi:hypothetical protein